MIRPTMVRVHVHRSDFGTALGFDRGDQCVRLRCQMIVRRECQHGNPRQSPRSSCDQEFLCMRLEFIDHAFGGDTRERFHVLGHRGHRLGVRPAANQAHVRHGD